MQKNLFLNTGKKESQYTMLKKLEFNYDKSEKPKFKLFDRSKDVTKNCLTHLNEKVYCDDWIISLQQESLIIADEDIQKNLEKLVGTR